uniref:serine/arginine repetitive matrix protein 1-like n=1 Tax=Styela clava TaxID=7725 RepID=UPI001939C4FA|nr:serine/arginine repetitive matrix protein 1-like [Styela clava]
MLDSTYIMLIPPNPSPRGTIEMMKMEDFFDSVKEMNYMTKKSGVHCYTQTTYVGKKNAGNDPIKMRTREAKTQTKRKVKDVSCNAVARTSDSATMPASIPTVKEIGVNTAPVKRSSIVLPVRRTSTATSGPEHFTHNTSKTNKISYESYIKMRRESSEATDDNMKTSPRKSGFAEFQEQMDYLGSHLERLKNLMKSVSDDVGRLKASSMSGLVTLTEKYADHILQLNKKFATESPSHVMAQDKIVMAAIFEDHSFWHLTFSRSCRAKSRSPSNDRERKNSVIEKYKSPAKTGKENTMKRRIDIPTGVACPNVRDCRDDSTGRSTKRRRFAETRESVRHNENFVRSPRRCRTPPTRREENRPERPKTAHHSSSNIFRSEKNSRASGQKPRYSQPPFYSRRSSKSPRPYTSHRSRSPTSRSKPKRIDVDGITLDSHRTKVPDAFRPKPYCHPKAAVSTPRSPSPLDGATTSKPLLPTPDTPPMTDKQESTSKTVGDPITEQAQPHPSSPAIGAQKVYPKTSTLKESLINSPQKLTDKTTEPPASQETLDSVDIPTIVIPDSPGDSQGTDDPQCDSHLCNSEPGCSQVTADPQNDSHSCISEPGCSQVNDDPQKDSHLCISEQPKVPPSPIKAPESSSLEPSRDSTTKAKAVSKTRPNMKKRNNQLQRRQHFGPNHNANFSRISTQITSRNDYHSYPFPHPMHGGMMSRSTRGYYPPNMTSFLSDQYYMQRYNNRQAYWAQDYSADVM